MKKYKKGYTTGVYDLFHIGHLNILRKSKNMCEYLVVGVTIDELVSYKNKTAVIKQEDRYEIVKSIKYVDEVVYQKNMDKMDAWRKLKFDVIFVGDDWKGTEKWNNFEEEFYKVGVDIVYFKHTDGISSTQLREKIKQK